MPVNNVRFKFKKGLTYFIFNFRITNAHECGSRNQKRRGRKVSSIKSRLIKKCFYILEEYFNQVIDGNEAAVEDD